MAKTRSVRVVVRLAPRTVLRYEQLAQQFGYTRSELYRVGLEHGFASVKRWCERARDPELLFAAAVSPGGQTSSPEPTRPSRSLLSAETPIAQLAAFAGNLVAQSASVADVRQVLLAKADELGLSRAQADPYVDALAVDVARAFATAADGTARSRRAGGSSPEAVPTSSGDHDPPSDAGDGVPGSQLDLDVDVPELD